MPTDRLNSYPQSPQIARDSGAAQTLHSSAAGTLPSRTAIEELQLGKLRVLLRAVRSTNPFYMHKLAAGAPDWHPASLAEYFQTVPLTTKHELIKDRLANPPYGTNLTFPLETYVRCHQTSGTTTMPIRWLDTPESWNHIVENWLQIFAAAGVTPHDRFFFAFSFGPFLGFWSALEAAMRLGCFVFPGGAMSSRARRQAILDNGITVLCCTPTYAQHLGELAHEKKANLDRSRLRLLIVAGEAGGSIPATRARLERLWPGASVFDHHGMTEVGPVTYQCPNAPGVLHVIESAYLPEVIDPSTGVAVRPGSSGELVLTTLDRTGSPLLRYRTGDIVKPRSHSVCPCGRQELALEGGILGRSDDMVVIRGVNVYPSLVEDLVREFPEVAEYRVQLDCRPAMPELSVEVELVGAGNDAAELLARLEESFQETLHLRVPVRVVPSGSLPRFEMKAQRWNKTMA
jgi:phenylacetate-CoA ligase